MINSGRAPAGALTLALAWIASIAAAAPAFAGAHEARRYVPGELLVRFAPQTETPCAPAPWAR